MSENLQKLLKEALLNNSYDYDDLHNSIKKEWQRTFSYLYYLQKAKVEYEELFYFSNDNISRDDHKIGDLHLNKMLFATFSVDYNCISYNREPYRVSRFYGKEITYEDMVYNPQIFYKIPLVIIDDNVIYDYKVKIHTDSTEFILPFKRNFVIDDARNPVTDDIVYKEHKIQVLIVDNIYYQRFTCNKNSLHYNHNTKTITISKDMMVTMSTNKIISDVNSFYMKKYGVTQVSNLTNDQIYSINKEIKRREDVVKLPKKIGKYFVTLHLPNAVGKKFELGTELLEMYDDGDVFTVHLPDYINELINSHTNNIFVSVIFINNLHSHTFYHGSNITTAREEGSDILVVEKENLVPYKCPIPVENFMVFKQSSGTEKWILNHNYDMIDMYYPNIYILNEDNMNPGDSYKVYYFYYNIPDMEYTCMFNYYFKFLLDISDTNNMEKIINDIYYDRYDYNYTDDEKIIFKRIFNKILNYTAYHYKYGDMDFTERYLKNIRNFDKVPIEYKDERFKSWIKENPWILRDYVKTQNDVGASYHLFANTIDLDSRLRFSTETELGINDMYIFDEPRYVFAFSNHREYPVMLDCRVFVDGLLVGDVYQRRKLFMDYLYIPQSYIKPDSYIELEVFPRYTYSKDFQLSSIDDTVEVNITEPTENISPTIADLIIWEDSDETLQTVVDIRDSIKYEYKKVTPEGELFLDPRFTTYEIQLQPNIFHIEATVGLGNIGSYAVISFYDNNDTFISSRVCLNTEYSEHLSTNEEFICDTIVPNDASTVRIVTRTDVLAEPVIKLYERNIDPDGVRSRYNPDDFKIVSKYSRGDFEVSSDDPKKPIKFTRLTNFTISAKSETAVGKKFKLAFSKIPIMVRFTIDRPGYAFIDTRNDNFNYNTEYIRIFRNGRLVPKVKYRLLTGYSTPKILFMEWFEVGDIVYIDITPYRYTQIYHKKNINKRDTLIDLRGVINKPFDISYYDVYLNGRKLSLNNVFTITPWLITLVNMKSNYNLDIYEKERDWEYFGLEYTDTDYYFSFEEMIASGIVKDDEFCKLIKDRIDELKDPRLVIHPNEFDEVPLDYSDTLMRYPIFYTFYYDELIPKTHVNPDNNQFNERFMDENFTEITDRYECHPKDFARNEFELERRSRYGKVLCLDPDIQIESEGWREIPLYLRFKDRTLDDVSYADNGDIILDVERVPNGDPSTGSDHYFVGPDNMVYNLGENIYHDIEDPDHGLRGEDIFRFRDRIVEDAYYDGDGRLILDTDRGVNPSDSDYYYITQERMVYDMSDDMYEDEEDQPLIPDGMEYLRLKDRDGDDGWYYDEYGRLIIDSERTYRSYSDYIYSLDGQVYEDEIIYTGAKLVFDVGHMDEVPEEYLNTNVDIYDDDNSIHV